MRVSKLQTKRKGHKGHLNNVTPIWISPWIRTVSSEQAKYYIHNFKLELRAFGIWNFSLKQNSLADFGFEFLWVLEFMREMNCIVSIWNINQISW
jgi:hypothetical protein